MLMDHEPNTTIKYEFINRDPARPTNIAIDASSICQLHCPICPTSLGINKSNSIGSGYLKFEKFNMLIEKNPSIRTVELSNWGEIFLNPDLKQIIIFAHENKVSLTASNGVNLNSVSDDMLEILVRYKFRKLLVSIDGATNETYKKYRIGGDLDRVIGNVVKINAFKKKHGSDFPELGWQFIVFDHNVAEIEKAKQMAKDLDMKFITKMNWDSSYSKIKNPELVKSNFGLDTASKEEYEEKYKIPYLLPCFQLWNMPQINWDGKLLGCCVNTWGDFGNVFDEGLDKSLLGERLAYAKRMLLGKETKLREDVPCSSCFIYKNKISKSPIKDRQIFQDYCIRKMKSR